MYPLCAGHVCTASGQGSAGKAAPDEEDPKSVPEQTPSSERTADSQFQVHLFTILSPPLSVSDNCADYCARIFSLVLVSDGLFSYGFTGI